MDELYLVSCVWRRNIRRVRRTSLIYLPYTTNQMQLIHIRHEPCFSFILHQIMEIY